MPTVHFISGYLWQTPPPTQSMSIIWSHKAVFLLSFHLRCRTQSEAIQNAFSHTHYLDCLSAFIWLGFWLNSLASFMTALLSLCVLLCFWLGLCNKSFRPAQGSGRLFTRSLWPRNSSSFHHQQLSLSISDSLCLNISVSVSRSLFDYLWICFFLNISVSDFDSLSLDIYGCLSPFLCRHRRFFKMGEPILSDPLIVVVVSLKSLGKTASTLQEHKHNTNTCCWPSLVTG